MLIVNEIFYSIQGEGGRSGCPSWFVRLSGCNKSCAFCDTEFESGKQMSLDAILTRLGEQPQCKWIIWTGGEPLMQLRRDIVTWFRDKGYKQAVETNGSFPIPEGLDYVCISPKVAEHAVKRNVGPVKVHELRYVCVPGRMDVPRPLVEADHKFLSPMFNGKYPDPASVTNCVRLCLENPSWRMSVQMHKWFNLL